MDLINVCVMIIMYIILLLKIIYIIKTFREVRDNHEKTGFLGKFITTFDYEGKGLPYNEWEIRLKVAIKADGSFKININHLIVTSI